MSYFVYGAHQHPANEVNLTRVDIRHRLSPRGRRLSRIVTMFLWGELQDTGAALLTKIGELNDAYRVDYADAGLYLDDGTLTPHRLTNSNSLSGVKVLHQSWPKGDHAELATKRCFSVTLQAEYANVDDQIVRWSETIQGVGNCGPRWELVPTWFGAIKFDVAIATVQRLVQYGNSIGFQGYAEPFGPLYPAYEHQDQREMERGSPTCAGFQYVNFPMRWAYFMEVPAPADPLPTTL